jgi:hypothetical protein
MSIFKPNLDKYASTYFVAPIDDYELEVVKVSLSNRKAKEVETPVIKVLFRIINAETSGNEYADKPVSQDFWLKTADDFQGVLRLAQAAMGFEVGTEAGDEAFKAAAADLDFSVDPDSLVLGTAYEKLVKTRVRCKLTSTADKQDATKFYQRFGPFRAF